MTRPSVLLTRRWPSAVEAVLAQTYDLCFNPEDRAMTSIEIADALRNFDYVCPTVTDQIGADLLTRRPVRSRALCNFGAGVGHIDLTACAVAGLLDTARGEIIDEEALIVALSRGDIASAGLDVYRDEPQISPTLRNLENTVLLPHLGSNR